MLTITKENLDTLKDSKYKVYSRQPLDEGVECFYSSDNFGRRDGFCITAVPISHIKCKDGRFFYTTEDLSTVADWFPKHVLNVGSKFVPCKKNKRLHCVMQIDTKKYGNKISSDTCLVDIGGLPAFNEDLSINEYRFYLTLFNDYTVKQCQLERHNLQDATFTSSKYDLTAKLQNSDFLKSKDFKVINVRRETEESVPVGLIIKENTEKYSPLDYGKVYINMENKISIVWH